MNESLSVKAVSLWIASLLVVNFSLVRPLVGEESTDTPVGESGGCVLATEKFSKALTLPEGSRSEQKDLYQEAIGACPGYRSALYNLGLIYYEEKDFEKAREKLLAALDTGSDRDVYVALGNVYLSQGDSKEAAEYFRKATQNSGDDVRGYVGLAVISEQKGDIAEAEDSLRQALQHNTRSQEVYLALGRVLEKKKEKPEALTSYESAERLGPSDAGITNAIARLYEEQGKEQEALRYYRKARLLDEKSGDSILGLARLQFKAGERQGAADFLAEREEDLASSPLSLGKAALLLADEGLLDKSRVFYQHAVRLASQDADVLAVAALAAAYCKDMEEGEKLFRQALLIRADDVAILNNLAVLLEAKGDNKAAAELYRKVLKIEPGNELAQRNVNRLKGRFDS
ncbi:MAG: tetratricopeptide repeat protein [bacterium]|nr:tetratricopeptide repeat protein [bacterium]